MLDFNNDYSNTCLLYSIYIGRAAVVLPVFQAISKEIGSRRITKALAILMPTVILVSTSSTIIGAGSHLIALDMLKEFNNKTLHL